MPCIKPISTITKQVSAGPDKTVCYPEVVHLENHSFEHHINHQIVRSTQHLINTQAGDTPSTVKGMLGWYEIKNNQRQVLSLSLANNTYHDQAAHPMTVIHSLTFDILKEKRCDLKDLFKPGSSYVEKLSNIIKLQIQARDIQTFEEFTTIRPDQDFYLADKAVVIYFQLYEITPYAFGFPMFPISVYELQDIIAEEGPLGRMAYND